MLCGRRCCRLYPPADAVELLAHLRGRGQRVQTIAQVERGRKTRDATAERAGFGGHETYRQADKVVESGTPRLVRAMDGGRESISAAALLTIR
jgi:hypothetical protein